MSATTRPTKHLRAATLIVVTGGVALLNVACQTTNQDKDTRPGTFLNPPQLGDVITPRVGSVVCLNELEALSMVNTGFFTPNCSTITPELKLTAKSIERIDAAEGPVIMIQTEHKGQTAWVPIPWHDWA